MTDFSCPALYKKNAGSLSITSANDKSLTLTWKASTVESTVSIPLAVINGLQASPASSGKLLLKIVTIPPDEKSRQQADGEIPATTKDYLFSFSDRPVMDNAKTALQNLIQQQRKAQEVAKTAAAIAASTSSSQVISLDTRNLLQNHTLQQKLLKDNKELMKTFQEAVIQGGLPNDEFWSTRIHILRAYALSSTQRRGAYNVLSTIKPTTTMDNQINVSLTREKIHDIFEQYPVVRRAYNDNVPKLSESEFWGRFFMSRLFRKLRGEKITANDPIDAILDKYLNEDNKRKRDVDDKSDNEEDDEIDNVHVPQYLDILGNEENDPQRLGNKPDITMQAGKSGKDTLALIRTMNELSQKMLNTVGDDDDNKEQDDLDRFINLSDLASDESKSDHLELYLPPKTTETNGNSKDNKNLEYLLEMKSGMSGTVNLNDVGRNSDEIKEANGQIFELIRLRARESSVNTDPEQILHDSKLLDQAQICHATSIEFLRHFWIHFQSGDAAQAPSIIKMVTSLKKSLERVDAVVNSAQLQADNERLQKMMQPLVVSINLAIDRYNKVLSEQMMNGDV